MGIYIICSEFNINTGDFYLKGEFNKDFENSFFYMQMEKSGYNISPHLAYKITNINEKKEFEISFNVAEFHLYPFFNNAHWTCYFLCDNSKIPVITRKAYNKHIFHLNSLFYVIPIQKETLIFIIGSKELNATLNYINFVNNNFILEIKTNNLDLKIEEIPFISIKCRDKKRIFRYYKSIDLPLKKLPEKNQEYSNYYLKESLSIFQPYLSSYEFFDVFFEIKNKYGIISIPLIKGKKIENNFPFTKIAYLHKIKPTIIGENQICLTINPYLTFKLSSFNLDKGQIIFDGYLDNIDKNQKIDLEISDIQSCQLVLKKIDIYEEFEYMDEIKLPLKLQGNYLNAVIDLKELDSFIKVDNSYDMFICLLINNFRVDIPLKTTKKIEANCIFNDLLIKLKLDESMNCSLYAITHQAKYRTVKIGVLGSCFSRTAFNSMEYFNPDYKKFYNCTFSQLYHSSIPALVSKSLKYDFLEDLLKRLDAQNLNPENKKFLMVDVKKSFFKELKKAEIDYLIIDLYSDAVKNLVMFPDGSFVGTFNLDLGTLLPELKYNIISPFDNNEIFFEIFKRSVDKFIERILEIIPEENIIVNKGHFAYKWQNEKGQIIPYEKNQVNIYKKINYTWDKLNNYLLKKLPNAKIIDMRYTNYIPHYDFPFEPAAMHYESGYYKEFLYKLNKIVFEDTLKLLKIDDSLYRPYSQKLLNKSKNNFKDFELREENTQLKIQIQKLEEAINSLKSNNPESGTSNLLKETDENLVNENSTIKGRIKISQKLKSYVPSLYILFNRKNNDIKNALINIKGYKTIKKNQLLDESYYLKNNSDVRLSGMDPLLHYMYHGFKEGRKPNPSFDNNYYLTVHSDVKKLNLNPLVHYSLYGIKEGRKIKKP